MKILSKFKRFTRRGIVLGAVAGAMLAVGVWATAPADASTTYNCDSNAVVDCGASSVSVLQSKYASGYKLSPASHIHNVYNWFGISSADITGMTNTNSNSTTNYTVAGSVTKTGDVKVGNTVVATNALTAGMQNISGSTRETSNGTTFYARKPSVSFLDSSLSAMVVMKNGVFQFAILNSCGNPVKATPKLPNYTITKQVRVKGTGSYVSSLNVKSGTVVEYAITVTSTGAVPVKNVTVHDVLPSDVTYVDNTLERDGVKVSNDSDFFGKGVVVPSITNGSKTVFLFDATVGPKDTSESCTPETLNNQGAMTAPGLPGKTSTATVNKQCLPKPVYACTNLGATKDSRTDFTFNATASASNGATIVGYVFNFGDGSSKTVTTSDVTASAAHTYTAAATYHASVSVQISVNGKTVNVTGENCNTSVTVKEAPAAECTGLTATPGDNNTVSVMAGITTSGGATLKNISYDFGDNTGPLVVTTKAAQAHTYAVAGTYIIVATVSFSNGEVANSTCKATVSFNTPTCTPPQTGTPPNCVTPVCTPPATGTPPNCVTPTPPVTPPAALVNTGAGSVVGIFAGASIIGAFGYRWFLSRRLGRD